MDVHAKPQDLLLAYNDGFTGYTSLSNMPQTLEPEVYPRDAGALGGSETPDGYYEDFTASLSRFVRDHPQLAHARRPGPNTGGDDGPAGPLDWKSMVISFGAGDSDSDSEFDGYLGGGYLGEDIFYLGEDADSGESATDEGGAADAVGGAANEGADIATDKGATDEGADGDTTGDSYPFVSLGSFIVDTDAVGGRAAAGREDDTASILAATVACADNGKAGGDSGDSDSGDSDSASASGDSDSASGDSDSGDSDSASASGDPTPLSNYIVDAPARAEAGLGARAEWAADTTVGGEMDETAAEMG